MRSFLNRLDDICVNISRINAWHVVEKKIISIKRIYFNPKITLKSTPYLGIINVGFLSI